MYLLSLRLLGAVSLPRPAHQKTLCIPCGPHWAFCLSRKSLDCVGQMSRHETIEICECARRMTSKAILSITRGDVQDAPRSLQLCAGQIVEIKVAIHFTRATFQLGDTEVLLVIDTSNTFNFLNREASLHNM